MWHQAWLDGHRGQVPADLMAARGPEHFQRYLHDHQAQTTVAIGDDRVIGLVLDDPNTGEVVQLAGAADWRGQGVADLLLDFAERRLARQHRCAWLAVVPGNTRARRFYARHGWTNEGVMTYLAPADSDMVPVPVHRYVKNLPSSALVSCVAGDSLIAEEA